VPAFLRPHAFASNVNLLIKRYIEDLDDWGAKQVSRCLKLGGASGGEFCFGGAGCPARRKEARKCAWDLNIHLLRPERTVLSGKNFDQSRGSDDRQAFLPRFSAIAPPADFFDALGNSFSTSGHFADLLRSLCDRGHPAAGAAAYLMLHDIHLRMRRLVNGRSARFEGAELLRT
jgi:hypothetical protein